MIQYLYIVSISAVGVYKRSDSRLGIGPEFKEMSFSLNEIKVWTVIVLIIGILYGIYLGWLIFGG